MTVRDNVSKAVIPHPTFSVETHCVELASAVCQTWDVSGHHDVVVEAAGYVPQHIALSVPGYMDTTTPCEIVKLYQTINVYLSPPSEDMADLLFDATTD